MRLLTAKARAANPDAGIRRDFPRIKLAPPEKFVFDPRLLL
jgi:hypothetical protein